jgi:hypothetical protein
MVKAVLKLVARAMAWAKPDPIRDQEHSPGVWMEGCAKLPIKKVTKTYAHTNCAHVKYLQQGHFVPMNRTNFKPKKKGTKA